MEEVWAVYLCLFLVVVVYFLMKQKPSDEVKDEKDSKTAPASSFSYSSSAGRRLECTEEELEQSLERLVGIFDKGDARKKETPREHSTSTQQLSQSNIQEKASQRKSHDIVDEIEQAVQETVDTDVRARRRQAQPGSRSHQED
uniref:Uncharacterized protein n=1 Tax=Sphaerodactylus townsendi TaxID=933632 RepID=A0ACB8FLX4_9SAUR